MGLTSVYKSCLEIHCNLTPSNPSFPCSLPAPQSLALCKAVTTASRLKIASHQPSRGNRCTQIHRQLCFTNFLATFNLQTEFSNKLALMKSRDISFQLTHIWTFLRHSCCITDDFIQSICYKWWKPVTWYSLMGYWLGLWKETPGIWQVSR